VTPSSARATLSSPRPLLQAKPRLQTASCKRPKKKEEEADVDAPVGAAVRPGAAALAGLATGVWKDRGDFRRQWELDRCFDPSEEDFSGIKARWNRGVERVRGWEADLQ